MFPHIHFGVEGVLPWLLYIGMFAAFLASVFWRPSIGLYVLVFALPMQTGRYTIHDFFLGPQFVDVLILGVLLGLLLKGKSFIPEHPLSRFLLLFSVFLYFSLWEGALFTNAPLPLWIDDARLSEWKNYVEMFLLATLVATAIREKRQIQLLIATMCLSVLAINQNYYSLISGRDISHYSDAVRDSGLLGYAGVNGFAAFQAMFSSFLLGLYASAKSITMRFGILALLATCVYCLLYSFSRGGYVGLLVGLIAIGLLKSRIFLVIAALLLIGWQVVLPESVQQRILMTTEDTSGGAQFDSSSEERLDLWRDAMDLFKRNPVTGTGFDTYRFMGRVGPYRDTHNYYVKVLVETGVVGLVLYLVLLRKLLALGRLLSDSTDDPFWLSISLAFRALLASAIALNFFGDRWTYQQVDGYLWVVVGLIVSGLTAVRQEREIVCAEDALESTDSAFHLASA